MDKLYELKDKLCEELDAMAEKPLNPTNLDLIYKLASAAKNVEKVLMSREGGRSYRGGSYDDGSYEGYSERGRMRAPRDSRGRYSGEGYSRHADMAEELRGMMGEMPEGMKHDMMRLVEKLESQR